MGARCQQSIPTTPTSRSIDGSKYSGNVNRPEVLDCFQFFGKVYDFTSHFQRRAGQCNIYSSWMPHYVNGYLPIKETFILRVSLKILLCWCLMLLVVGLES